MYRFSIISRTIKKNIIRFSCLIILSLLAGAFSLVVPLISGNFVDFLVVEKNVELLLPYMGYFAFFSLGLIVLNFACNRIFNSLYLKTTEDLCDYTIECLCNSVFSLDKKNNTYLTQRIFSDSQTVSNFVLSFFQNSIINAFVAVALFVFLWEKNIAIFLITITFSLLYILLYVLYKKNLYKYMKLFKEKQNNYFACFQDTISSTKFIRLHSILRIFQERCYSKFSDYYDMAQKYQLFSYTLSSLEGIISTAAQISIFLLGGYYVITNKISIGSLTVITSYFGLVLNKIRYFFNLAKNYQEFCVSYDRLLEIQNTEKYPNGNTIPSSVESISVENLSFGFEKELLSNFSKVFLKNNIYLIRGENGSVKTTFANIIVGMLRNNYTGTISINEMEIDKLNMTSLRSNKIVYVEQQPFLIRDTVMANLLLFSDETINYKQMEEYLYLLGMKDLILSLPQGLESKISETKDNFSGGEIQKICVIRALLSNADVLIFDEPTSAFDSQSKEAFYDLLYKAKNNRIIFIISHDDSITDIADDLIEL